MGIDDRQLRSVAYSPRRGVEPVRIVSIPQARGLALALGSSRCPTSGHVAQLRVDLPEVVIAQEVAEVVVVEDLLEDLRVVVHTSHDRLHELAVERKPEVLDAVVLRLIRQLPVSGPSVLELIEQELVEGGELGSEPVVKLLSEMR